MNIKLKQKDIEVLLNKKYKGSITVEASLSFTLTIFILFMMLGPLLIIKTTSDLLIKMNDANKIRCNYEMIKKVTEESSIYEKITSKINDEKINKSNVSKIEDIINFVSVIMNHNASYDFDNQIYRNIDFVYDKTNGNYDETTGIVKYDYMIDFKLPYNVLHVQNPISRLVINRRAFIGSDGDRFDKFGDTGEYIYLADNYLNSHIYHTNIDCTYLIKNTSSYSYDEVLYQKNSDNQNYSMCDYCFRNVNIVSSTECFITEYGDRFHYRENCPLMTAYVTKASRDYIERYELNLCSRCLKREKKDD